MTAMTLPDLRKFAETRTIVRAVAQRRKIRVQPIFFDESALLFWCAAGDDGGGGEFPLATNGGDWLKLADKPLGRPVAALELLDRGLPVQIAAGGFNPRLTEAVLLAWRFGLRAQLGYQKPTSPTVETRNVRIGRIQEGNSLVCEDLDRQAPRSFRLDRLRWLSLHPDETHYPCWLPEAGDYGRVLRPSGGG